MVFSSLIFLCIFLPINLLLYFINKNKTYRNVILLISSIFFYAWGEPIWVSILIFTGLFDYMNGRLVEKYRNTWKSTFFLVLSMAVNLFLLGFFKYSAFLTININSFFHINLPYSEFKLPIGISFYTFQTMSYVIDVYRGHVKAQRSPYKLLLFVSLFHQLVAGPIVRYIDIANQIDERKITREGFSYGITRFAIGLGKKVIIANSAGSICQTVFLTNLSNISVLSAWIGILMFALQIYYDFSGYSDMAIGLGKMFGFTYVENFNYPYISKSITEFWRRWHMSLGSFFRDYVYIPLGGNKKHMLLNLLITWALTGLWHGASWNFMFWGLYFAFFIIIEKMFLLKFFEKIPAVFSHIYLIFLILVGWVLFYFEDLGKMLSVLKIMFGLTSNNKVDESIQILIQNNIFFMIIAVILCTPLLKTVYIRSDQLLPKFFVAIHFKKRIVLPIFCSVILIASLILLVGESYNPFLYFRF